jgi:hypothetical protein
MADCEDLEDAGLRSHHVDNFRMCRDTGMTCSDRFDGSLSWSDSGNRITRFLILHTVVKREQTSSEVFVNPYIFVRICYQRGYKIDGLSIPP